MIIRSVFKDSLTGRFRESVIDGILVGYRYIDRSGVHPDKPTKSGFVIVQYPEGEGAIPLNNVLNWDELPQIIEQ